ncbi:MAG: glycosyltransferase family 39 protein [Elusimicrobiota bacterium]
MDNQIKKAFWYCVGITFIIKAMLAAAIPLISDEAYFVIWAQNLDFGYYDHPPMIAWVLRFVLFFGSSEFVLRLPAILSTILIGIGIYLIIRRAEPVKAYLIGILFLISPINLLYIPVSTDTPVIFFAFLSAVLLFLAVEKENYLLYLFSGITLGLAFLSKYFAVLLGLAYLAYFICTPKDRKKTTGFAVLFLSVIPFALVNIYWNYTHSWANLLFNLFNRNKQETFSFGKMLLYLVSQAYLITPPLLYYAYKKRRELFMKVSHSFGYQIFAFSFVVPLLVFFLLSFKKTIGLHWVLAFYPFLYIPAFFLLTEEQLLKSIRFMLFFSFAHLFLIGGLLSIPLEYMKNNKNYNMIVMGMSPGSVVSEVKPYEKDFALCTESYAESAVISYYYGKYFFVFGGGSHHGRQDDMITDFRQLKGGNILILRKSPPEMGNYKPYFRKVEIKQFEARKAVFYIILGYGFKYDAYKDTVLKGIKENYYNIPPWLPTKTDYFSEKYF